MAFDFLDGKRLASHRGFILSHLSRALLRNFQNAIHYLNGPYNERRKLKVCSCIAVGMNRLPDTTAAFVLEFVDRLAPEHVQRILLNSINRYSEVDYLDQMIADWLTANYRRQGYRHTLDSLRKNPNFWERLLALGTLPQRIKKDFLRHQ